MTSLGSLPYEAVTGPSSIFCRARSRIAVISVVKLPNGTTNLHSHRATDAASYPVSVVYTCQFGCGTPTKPEEVLWLV